MLHLAEAAELRSTHIQTTLIWNQLAVNPSRDIPEPRAITKLSRFFDQSGLKDSNLDGARYAPAAYSPYFYTRAAYDFEEKGSSAVSVVQRRNDRRH